jgi:hypothetical protein
MARRAATPILRVNSKEGVPVKTILVTIAAALAVAASAAAAPRSATLLIRHQVRGCHSWSVNGGAFKASQTLTLAKGARLVVVDNDVMPHTMIQLSGPHAVLVHPYMHMMSATATVVFPKAGRYVFKTKPGEDYMAGMKTIGEDNVLKLVVTVT